MQLFFHRLQIEGKTDGRAGGTIIMISRRRARKAACPYICKKKEKSCKKFSPSQLLLQVADQAVGHGVNPGEIHMGVVELF